MLMQFAFLKEEHYQLSMYHFWGPVEGLGRGGKGLKLKQLGTWASP